MSTHMLAPPLPANPVEAQRVEHTRLRRRVLYSMHEGDVRARLSEAVGPTRAQAWKLTDMTSNPAWYVCSQLAALHRETPEVTPPDGGEDVAASVSESGFWQLAQRVQRDTIGLNDLFVRVDIDPETKEPGYRLVPPDLVEIITNPFAPSQPLAMKEWIQDPDNAGQWVQLVTDPREALYMALDAEGIDVSARVLKGDFRGEAYPWFVGGKPVLPYIGYHAAETGYALEPYGGREVFEGSLQLGVYYSFFGHILRNAAWGQRWILGAEPVGGDVDEDGRRREIVADPATLLVLRQMEDAAGQAQVGQFAPPVDPDRILAAIERYEQRVVEMALSTVGVSRRESDVRSAMSLAVSREAQREAQRAYEPVFRRSDIRLLRLTSGLMGGPVDGWRIQYKGAPRDSIELDAELTRMQGQIAAGLLDKVTAYQQLHPGLLRDEAEAAVKTITETNRRLSGGAIEVVTGAPAADAPAPSAMPTIALTSTDIASIVTVDEARASQGLPPIGGTDGALTVAEFQAKNAAVIAAAANATAGTPTPTP
jgi:hypothetical protein